MPEIVKHCVIIAIVVIWDSVFIWKNRKNHPLLKSTFRSQAYCALMFLVVWLVARFLHVPEESVWVAIFSVAFIGWCFKQMAT
jgi:hypothetical protein